MRVVNKSRKIIAIAGEPLLPGKDMELSDGYENHPSIADYMKSKVLVHADKTENSEAVCELSDEEKEKIAEEAVAKYKAEQDAIIASQAAKDAEIKAVNKMKKDELVTKAMGMGIEVADSDTMEVVRGKILEQISQ